MQVAINAHCGDRPTEINDYQSINKSLDYPCTTGLSPQDINGAAAALRSDATLAPLLRLRIANIYSAATTTVMSDEVVASLRARSKEKP